MKILVVSDEISPYLYDYYTPGKLDDIDLIISCGDLKPEYLSFLVTLSHAPLFYVHGNHDGRYEQHPPEGCDCIEDKIVTFRGVRILGLGGSRAYSGGPHQFTEQQMRRRIRRLYFNLRRSKGVDIIVSHAPVLGYGDLEDRVHQGFESFRFLIDRYKPRYFLHGHVHLRYLPNASRINTYNGTTIINACERYILEIEEP